LEVTPAAETSLSVVRSYSRVHGPLWRCTAGRVLACTNHHRARSNVGRQRSHIGGLRQRSHPHCDGDGWNHPGHGGSGQFLRRVGDILHGHPSASRRATDERGTAVFKFRPGSGSHSYKAVFAGTPNGALAAAGSTSGSTALTVTATSGRQSPRLRRAPARPIPMLPSLSHGMKRGVPS
jgi:hypothetical protein